MRARCIVPLCTNTSKITPNKLFFRVPNKKTVRDKWLKLARQDPEDTTTNSQLYFCEDHFDLPNDMENYREYLLTGPGRVVLKPNSFPKKFPWQCKQKSVCENNYDEFNLQQEGGTEFCHFVEIGPESSVQINLEDAQQSTLEVTDTSIQVCRVCLAVNVRMYHMSEHQLSAMYERVTGMEINTADKLPQQLCWECFARLSSANRFVAKAFKTHWLLLNEINSGRLMTTSDIKALDKAQHKIESTLGKKFHNVNEYDFLVTEETVEPNIPYKMRITESATQNNVSVKQLNAYKEQPSFTTEVLRSEEYIIKDEPVQLDEEEDDTVSFKEEKVWPNDSTVANKSVDIDDWEDNTFNKNADISNEEQISIKLENTHDEELLGEMSQEGRRLVEKSSEVCEVIKQNHIDSNSTLSPLSYQSKNQPGSGESVKGLEYIDCGINNLQDSFEEQVTTYGNTSEDISANTGVAEKNSSFIHINNKSLPDIFICDICVKSFTHKPDLILHIQKHPKRFYCIYCSYKTHYSSSFKAHNNYKHTKNIVFLCSFCDYIAYQKSDLQRHINAKHTKNKLFKCSYCIYETCNKNSIKIHINTKHTRSEVFRCPHCSYKAYIKRCLELHINSKHTKSKVFKCPYCVHETFNKVGLRMHVNSKHTKSEVFNCPYCSYKTYAKQSLQRHINTKHTQSKVFKCPHCIYKTSDKVCVQQHINSKHTRSEVFSCPYCSYKAYLKRCLEQHVNSKHTRMRVFKCPYCIHKTYSKAGLHMHVNTKHTKSEVFNCPHCGYETYAKQSLQRHINAKHTKSKVFRCPYCIYKTSEKVKVHRHINSKHTKREVFNCPLCSFKAYTKGVLQRHIKVKHTKLEGGCLEQHVNSEHIKSEVFNC